MEERKRERISEMEEGKLQNMGEGKHGENRKGWEKNEIAGEMDERQLKKMETWRDSITENGRSERQYYRKWEIEEIILQKMGV